MKRALLPILLVALAVLGSGCGAINALQEPADLFVTVNRMKAINESLDQAERFLTKTPIGTESAWVSQLAVPVEDAGQYIEAWKNGPASKPGFKMMPTDLYALAWKDIQASPVAVPLPPVEEPKPATEEAPAETPAEAPAGSPGDDAVATENTTEAAPAEAPAPETAQTVAKAASVMEALGGDVAEAFLAWNTKVNEYAELKGQVKKAEADMDEEGVTPEKKAELEKIIQETEVKMEALDKEIEPLKEALYTKLDTAKLTIDKGLAEQLLIVFTSLDNMYTESASLGTVLMVHYGMGLRDYSNQLSKAAGDIARAVIKEKLGKVVNFTAPPQIEIQVNPGAEPTVTIKNMPGVNLAEVGGADQLGKDIAAKLWVFIKDVLVFTSDWGKAMNKIDNQRAVVKRATKLLKEQYGLETPMLPEIEFPSIATPAANGQAAPAEKKQGGALKLF